MVQQRPEKVRASLALWHIAEQQDRVAVERRDPFVSLEQ